MNCSSSVGYVTHQVGILLKGEYPLPVQQITKIDLVTPMTLGLTIPETLLATDEVIQ